MLIAKEKYDHKQHKFFIIDNGENVTIYYI